MTKKLLLRTAALTCALLLGLTALAQTEFQPYCVHYDCTSTAFQNPNVKHYSSSSYQETNLEQMREQARKLAAKAEGNLCTVTLNLEYDPEVFVAPYLSIFFNDAGYAGSAFDNGEGALIGEVEPGIYDIISCFRTEDYSQYYVIFEQQQVKGDLTLTLNPEACTNSITVNNYGPDGELLKLGLGHLDEDGQVVEDEEGDYYFFDTENALCRKDLGVLFQYDIMGGGPQLEEEKRTSPLGFHVNDVSDRFYLRQRRFLSSQDYTKTYICYFNTDNLTTSVLENDPNDYVQQVENFKYTPRAQEQIGYGVANVIWEIGKTPKWSILGHKTNRAKLGEVFTHDLWANVPETNPYDPDEYIVLQNFICDYGEVETETWGELVLNFFDPTAWIFGSAMRVNNGQIEYVNIGHHNYDGNWITFNPLYGMKYDDGTISPRLLPAPEAFTYPTEQVLGVFGDNCPINAVNVTTYEANNQINTSLASNYVGRYGESLHGDMGSTMTLKYNGEEVDLSTFSPTGKGTWEFAINNPNIEVDGLPGHNTTTVYFDQNQDDMTPPSLEMLHFKNADGNVTDRFATAEEGTMEFYASDFNYVYYPERWNGVFECQPVEVVMEYAPYGTEDWNELTVEEIPEFYQEPGWGYFYRGSLAGVTGQGEKGWFDLRFRLQDASGNWMDQVVSPAFRIDDHAYSSVATIGSGNAHEVARYSIDGKRVDTTHQGVTIIKMSDGTARKVLVK